MANLHVKQNYYSRNKRKKYTFNTFVFHCVVKYKSILDYISHANNVFYVTVISLGNFIRCLIDYIECNLLFYHTIVIHTSYINYNSSVYHDNSL